MTQRLQPSFIGIGFQRCGTSWLNQVLFEHPEIGKPRSGLHFFNKTFERGTSWYEEKLAATAPEKGIVGEFSTTYSYPEAAATVADRIQKLYPNVKLIFSIRHPVERCRSDYKRLHRRGEIQEHNITFEEALLRYPQIRARSLYAPVLSQFYNRFPSSNIHVIRYDDIQKHGHAVVSRLFDFLHIDFRVVPPSTQERLGASYEANSVLVERGIRWIQSKGQGVLRRLPEQLARPARRMSRSAVVNIRNVNTVAQPKLDPYYHAVIKEFVPDILRTMQITGVNLENWLENE